MDKYLKPPFGKPPFRLSRNFRTFFGQFLAIWSMLLFGDPVQCTPFTILPTSTNNAQMNFIKGLHRETPKGCVFECPKDPAVPKILHVVTLTLQSLLFWQKSEKSLAASDFFAAGEAENPAISAAEWLRARLRPPWSLQFCDAIPAFWQKTRMPRKKARIFLPAEPLKSLEKRAKTHKKARKTAKRKKRGKRKKRELDGQGNLLRVVFLVRRVDLLSRRALRGHHFPGNYRHLSSQRKVHGVLNLGGVVKTLRRSNSVFLLSS